ncbi:gamma-glutamyltransferase [Pseudaminobacter sp. 19-2017]|uniref:Glutathione hydrolase proenzyme n=1 Tax=Pseudaminobacter soli (ex Zhang et al. 2022) TaxID=2831468 RepID=A0A942ICA3_9HYPH|nr:gamma-glutamyltransferase [Pseudaminobacter soli]MBS3652491.1 gamma-glutamyltransferase [Pseudaminobacter soli]
MKRRDSMVVAPQPEAVEAGAEILKSGGNAVDAAIACALVQGVVDPMMCGIAGFGSMGVYAPSQGRHKYIDFHAPAPLAARDDMWEDLIEGEARDGYGFILAGRVNDIGYQSACVPASLRAYELAHSQYGSLPWAEVMAPSIDWAKKGWTVRPHVHAFWSDEGKMGRVANHERLRHTPSGRALYCREDGSPKMVGDLVINPDLANTLEAIAREGADVFYKGDIAGLIAEDMKANGGLISREDLATYQPKVLDPLWGEYRGYRVATNHPPGGGIMLLQMLNILENFDLRDIGHNTDEYIRIVCEAMKYATIDKDRFVGDPDFVDVPVSRLAAKDYAKELADRIRAGDKADVPRFNSGLPSKDTTHISIVDRDGNCVTMTHSLGMPSGVVTKGLGFMHNGCMGVFDPRPGRAGSIAPGKARFSSICPSIIFKDGEPYVVVGAPGATQIAMGVLQSILNVLDFDMTMSEAVSSPRFSATSNAIDVTNRIPRFVTRALEEKGYEVIRSPLSFSIAWVHGIRIVDGIADGGADPGADGMALAV